MKNRPFPAVDAGRIEIVPISEEKGEIIKVTNEIGENIPASKLIEDFFYVPFIIRKTKNQDFKNEKSKKTANDLLIAFIV